MMLEADLEGLDLLESTTNQSALVHLVSPRGRPGGRVEMGCHRQKLKGSLRWQPPS